MNARRAAPTVIVVVTTILLVLYSGVILWAWLSPSTDPQGGMAEGFLSMVTAGLLVIIGLFLLGIRKRRRGLVWFVFSVCALPSLSIVARGIYLLVRSIQS